MTPTTPNTSAPPAGATPSELLTGSVTVTVNYLEPVEIARGEFGQSQEIAIKLIPLGKFATMPDPDMDPAGFIAAVCGRNVDWTNKVHPDSAEAIMQTARRINAGFFAARDRRRGAELQREAVMLSALSPEQLAELGKSNQQSMVRR